MKNLTKKQKIIAYLKTVKQASLQEVIEGTGISYYTNNERRVREMLDRFVCAGVIEQVEKDVFKVKEELR